MADLVARKLPLRHPAENPTFILMVVLNFAILAVLIDFLASAALIPPALRGTNWEATWRAVAGAIILVAPAIMVVRQVQRASADTVQVSELVDQGRHLGGFWVGISQLPRTHPWTVRRIWRLHQLSLFGPADTVDQAHRPQPVA